MSADYYRKRTEEIAEARRAKVAAAIETPGVERRARFREVALEIWKRVAATKLAVMEKHLSAEHNVNGERRGRKSRAGSDSPG